jgi:2-keto-4-pentenoate hydratase
VDAAQIRATRVAAAIGQARATRRPTTPPSSTGCRDVEDAYLAQQALDDAGRAAGERPVGYKVGLTTAAAQAAFGIDEPVRGTLMSTMLVKDGAILELTRLLAPRVEAEVALILGHAISGANVDEADVVDAVASVAPAIEVVDSRIEGWAANAVDLVADAGAAAAVVLGEPVRFTGADSLPQTCVLHHGRQVHAGTAGAVQGGVLGSLAWLARHLAASGRGLEAGDVVMAGTWTTPQPVERPIRTRADFGPLGSVEVVFA